MNHRFIPFELTVEQESDGSYTVNADFQGRKRRSTIPAGLPLLKAAEIEQSRTWLRRGLFNLSFAKDFGSRLFLTLFSGEVLELFRTALAELDQNTSLRLLLDLPLPAGLEQLPWELLYDEKGELGFLSRSYKAPLARHYTDLERMHGIPEMGPLRVLIVAASPPSLPPVGTDQEIAAIQQSLEKTSLTWSETLQSSLGYLQQKRTLKGLKRHLIQRRLVECQLLPHATYPSLQENILTAKNNETPFHVIHFIGHGEGGECSSLIFESSDELLQNTGEPVSAEAFAELVSEESIGLVVLNACETAGAGLIENTAREIQRKGVPAVIGMQVAVLDRSAVAFAEQLYGAWALGEPLESALAYSRRQIPDERPGAASDWVIPALYMGPEDGLTLHFETPKVRTPRPLKFTFAAISAAIFMIGAIAAFLSVPSLTRQVRMEVPLIRCWFPYPMENEPNKFNVVVAEFNVRSASGRWRRDSNGLKLADDIYTRLESEKEALGGSGFNLRPQPLACPLPAGDPNERALAAGKLAEKLHADVLIFGVIDKASESQGEFTPQFYINTRGFEQGEEIIGPYKLGDPSVLDLPIDLEEIRAGGYQGLNVREAALVEIVGGLVSYALDNQDDAIQHFENARNLKGLRDKWGKDFIYLMLGNAFTQKSARLVDLNNDYAAYVDLVNQAMSNFREALRINPEYARAQLGLAESMRRLAQNPFEPDQPYDLNLLNEAEKAFQKALTLKDSPESANIPVKVHFGYGMINIMRASQATDPKNAEAETRKAEAEFQEVIKIWQMNDADPSTTDKRINTQAGHAYISLAWIARDRGELDQAALDIEQAVTLASPYNQGRYLIFLAQIYEQVGDQENICESYRRAVDAAERIGDTVTADYADNRLVELGCEGL